MNGKIRARTAAGVLAALTVAAPVTACASGGPADKAGSGTVQLRLASIDDVNNNGQSYGPQAFVDELNRLSGGRVKVEVVTHYHEADATSETQLVRAIAAGEVDGGWPSTRAFGAAGIGHLRATEAPLTITNYAAEGELVSGPVAGRLLATLKGTGVQGLGLAVGPLRRPFAAKRPLVSAADWKGARVRAFNSPTQAATYRDLGAEPVMAGSEWTGMVQEGRLRAAEFDVAQYVYNDAGDVTPYVTGNVVLWPKVFVLSLSQKRFDSLTAQQQGWVRTAAARATAASVAGSHDETALAAQLCAAGVTFRRAGAKQLAGLRAAVQPTISAIAADPVDGPLLQDVEAVAARHPAPDDPAPADCGGSPGASAAPGDAVPDTPSSLPDGTYRISIGLQDLTEHGIGNSDGLTGVWTLTVAKATYLISCRPADLPGTDCGHSTTDKPLEAGVLRGTGDVVHFVFDPEVEARLTGCTLPATQDESLQRQGHCGPGGGFSMKWTVHDRQLVLSDNGDPTTGFSVKPWTRIR